MKARVCLAAVTRVSDAAVKAAFNHSPERTSERLRENQAAFALTALKPWTLKNLWPHMEPNIFINIGGTVAVDLPILAVSGCSLMHPLNT